MKYYLKENQIFCWNCGQQFQLQQPQPQPQHGGLVVVECPNPGCNRGSWASKELYGDFVVPVEMEFE